MTLNRAQALAELTAPGAPYALVEQTLHGRRVRIFANAPRSLRTLYQEAASEAPFLSYGEERWTFREAWEEAGRLARVLATEAGVRPGDRVAIAMRNYPEWVLGFMAITGLGAVAVAMNAHWQADEIGYALRETEAVAVLADAERLARIAQAGPFTGLTVFAVRAPVETPGVRDLAASMQAVQGSGLPTPEPAPDDLATLLYTSGSTGHPKGVIATHRHILSSLLSWELDRAVADRLAGGLPVPPGPDGTLLAVPLFHVTGLAAALLASFRLQRRVVCLYKWDPEVAASVVERERLRSVIGPAAVTGDLLRVAAEGRHDLSSLLTVGGGGAPRAPEQVQRIPVVLPTALPATGWGMTETFAIGAGIAGPDYLQRPDSSGRAAAVLDLRVVDPHGRPLPCGERGELQVRGASLFLGYWRRPEATAESFDGDWFRTGDLAWIDEEGFVYIVDRIKDLIIRGGENIGCGAVEAALLQHPAVREAAVYAVPDERLGEEVGATVYCDPPVDAETLRAFVATRLAAFEVPRHLHVSPEPLPRTATGKILKRALKDAARGGRVGSG